MSEEPQAVHEPGRLHGRYLDKPMCSGYLLQQMESRIRPTDVIVNTLPKCGQTWLTALLMSIKLKGDFSQLDHFFNHVPWLEVTWLDQDFRPIPLTQRLEEMEAVSDPRVFKMHVPWDVLPLRPGAKNKIITITRNVQDLPYSFYRHMHSHLPEFFDGMGLPRPPVDFDVFFDAVYMSRPPTDWIQTFWEHRNDENVLVLRFEDLKHDLLGQAKRLIEFLEWEPLSDEVLERDVLPAVSIGNMKEMLHSKLYPNTFKQEEGSFIRDGAIGQNCSKLSDAQLARLRKTMEEKLPEECVKYWYRE